MSVQFNVLVFEDEETGFVLLETALKILNVNIFHAETGAEGIDLFKNKDFDLVILDLNLPDMNGFEILEELKEIKKDIPIIAQTGYALGDEKARCKAAGCIDFFLKPIKINKLQEIIEKYRN